MEDILRVGEETERECAKRNNLDMRHRYLFYDGVILTVPTVVTMPCSGCEGGGCSECGYQGKRRCIYPALASEYRKKSTK